MIMKKIFLPLFILVSISLFSSNLIVTVNNIQIGKGNIIVEIYDSKIKFF